MPNSFATQIIVSFLSMINQFSKTAMLCRYRLAANEMLTGGIPGYG